MNKNNERITYEEFMTMFKCAPRMCYTLYEKAEDEIEKLKKENQQYKSDYEKEKYLVDKLTRQLKDEYKNTEKQKELGDHYKHLYSVVKKQKDDVVEYIKENEEEYGSLEDNEKIILRMLGEIE